MGSEMCIRDRYIPGLASFVEQLDHTSPFLVDIGAELIGLYIEHDGEWDLISDGLGAFFLNEAGEFASGFVADQLPESWGVFGDRLGEVTSLAISSEGNPDVFGPAIATLAGDLAGLGVGSVLGDEESIIAAITAQVTEIVALSELQDNPGAFIDQQLTLYIFGVAGEELSSLARGGLTAANGGQSNALIESTVDLIDLAVSNGWRDSDELEAILINYASGEFQDFITSQFPECAPGWAVGLGDQVVGEVFDGITSGNTGAIGSNVTHLLVNAAATGQIDGSDLGTCFEQANEDAPDSEDAEDVGVPRPNPIDVVGEVINLPYVPGELYGSAVIAPSGRVSIFAIDTDGSVIEAAYAPISLSEVNEMSSEEFNLLPRNQREYIHFEVRNSANTGLPPFVQDAIHDEAWTELEEDKAVFHQDPNTPGIERKFIHEDGREAVYYQNSGRLVTDPRYRGTYNFVNPAGVISLSPNLEHGIQGAIADVDHFWFDIQPWRSMVYGGTVRGPEPGAVGNSDCNGPVCSDDFDDDDDLIPAWLDLDDKDPNRGARYPFCTDTARPHPDNHLLGWEVETIGPGIVVSSGFTTCAWRAEFDGLPTTPYCSASFVDSDGDGWGVENDLACVVAGSAAARSIGR